MVQKYIYFHIATAGPPGNFVEVVHRTMTQIQESGLLQEVEEIRYVVVGDDNKVSLAGAE
jgi:hypothetical protein